MLEELRGWAERFQGQRPGQLGLWQKQPLLPGIKLLWGWPQGSMTPPTPVPGSGQVYTGLRRNGLGATEWQLSGL